MADARSLALEAARRLRQSSGFRGLGLEERRQFEDDLRRIEATLGGARKADPYARGLADHALPSATLPREGEQSSSQPPSSETGQIGQRAAATLDAVNFPGFVAGLLTGTFQAIVDATSHQLREYSTLVASLSRSAGDFSRDHVSPPQVRDWLVGRHPSDLQLQHPRPGEAGETRLAPVHDGDSPAWLGEYGLEGATLDGEFVEGQLLTKARERVAEERLQTLAGMVLLGIQRVIVDKGDIRARLQFHAVAKDTQSAEGNQGAMAGGEPIARRAVQAPNAQMMVSTLRANAQAEAAIRADLMGEVRISFRTETFPLERFADSAAIELLNRHARWQGAASAPAAVSTPARATSESEEGDR